MTLTDQVIDLMTEEQVKIMLKKIINKLDELGEQDFFGTEGWEKFFDIY